MPSRRAKQERENVSDLAWALLAFTWALGEATVFPLPPEVLLIPLLAVHPEPWLELAVASVAGSLSGGSITFLRARSDPELARTWLPRVFGVAPGMITKVARWIGRYGTQAVAFSAWTGIPFKIFACLAGAGRSGYFPFLMASLAARGGRALAIAALVHLVAERWRQEIQSARAPLGVAYVVVVVLGFWWNQRAHRRP